MLVEMCSSGSGDDSGSGSGSAHVQVDLVKEECHRGVGYKKGEWVHITDDNGVV